MTAWHEYPRGRGVTVRRATPEDTDECHRIMWHAITDLVRRHGIPM
jgi:hypothetical protein